ncbi:MAG TPA: NADP oxidoreductase, partial [Deinococcales bacterium]|nr:NADP oxidoreductase [Deinococcales bacterium]
RNELSGAPGLGLEAVPTDETEVLEAGLVLRSIGYRGTALPGVPFDEQRAVIPHERGRVLEEAGGRPVPGLYTTGWIKRGPSGVIGSNKADALETAASLLADPPAGSGAGDTSPDAVPRLLKERGVQYVCFADWEELDRLEIERGTALGRPRLKFTRSEEMLEALKQPA